MIAKLALHRSLVRICSLEVVVAFGPGKGMRVKEVWLCVNFEIQDISGLAAENTRSDIALFDYDF